MRGCYLINPEVGDSHDSHRLELSSKEPTPQLSFLYLWLAWLVLLAVAVSLLLRDPAEQGAGWTWGRDFLESWGLGG